MNEIDRYNKWISSVLGGCGLYDFKDKDRAVQSHVLYMLNRTQSMFKWSGLPDSIPQRMMELYLQINGYVGVTDINGILYAMRGGLGGEPDAYYMPTIFTIANPALDVSRNLKINEECIIIPNDACYIGLMPMFTRYATGMMETELSINIAAINSRIIDLITAPDDRTKASAEKYLSDVVNGEVGVIASNEFFEGLKATPYGGTSGKTHVTDLIELEQYYKASWFNELGLNANYNMKREALSTAESQLNDDALLPLIDNMLECRKLGAEKINNLYGTSISVELASSWEDNAEEIELEHEAMEDEKIDPDTKGGDDDEI